MTKFIVRPYFGYDCDSEMGFNNGCYLNEITVKADNEHAAIEQAMNHIQQTNPSDHWEEDSHMGDNYLYREFDHVWRDQEGNEYQDEEAIPAGTETNIYYRCQYIDFSDVKEKELIND
jgi:hypothetical protein